MIWGLGVLDLTSGFMGEYRRILDFSQEFSMEGGSGGGSYVAQSHQSALAYHTIQAGLT